MDEIILVLVACMLISFILTLLGLKEALSIRWQQISSELRRELTK